MRMQGLGFGCWKAAPKLPLHISHCPLDAHGGARSTSPGGCGEAVELIPDTSPCSFPRESTELSGITDLELLLYWTGLEAVPGTATLCRSSSTKISPICFCRMRAPVIGSAAMPAHFAWISPTLWPGHTLMAPYASRSHLWKLCRLWVMQARTTLCCGSVELDTRITGSVKNSASEAERMKLQRGGRGQYPVRLQQGKLTWMKRGSGWPHLLSGAEMLLAQGHVADLQGALSRRTMQST